MAFEVTWYPMQWRDRNGQVHLIDFGDEGERTRAMATLAESYDAYEIKCHPAEGVEVSDEEVAMVKARVEQAIKAAPVEAGFRAAGL